MKMKATSSTFFVLVSMVFGFNAVAADDCYYGFKASSASSSCTLNSASFQPGSTNYCRVNADCHWYSVSGGHQYHNNNGVWYVGDVRRLINNNGVLEVGYHSNSQVGLTNDEIEKNQQDSQ